MIEDSEKRDRQLTFELHNSHVCEKRSKAVQKLLVFPHAGKDGFEIKNCLRREKESKMSIRRRLYCCTLPD